MSVRGFREYPNYKDSGVQFLGAVPAHWAVTRLRYLSQINPETLREDTNPDREIVYVDIGGVDGSGRIVNREQMRFGASPSRARRVVRDGDIIVSTVRTYLRAIAPIREAEPTLIVSTGFAVVRPSANVETRFAAYALRAPYFVERVVARSTGVSYPAINESAMATFELAIPSMGEQEAIADFLDHETAKIDALIVKTERLAELIEEKRQALITRAVTQGLDPRVPMKDSGVEWFPGVPAHWEVARVKHACDRVFVGIAEAATFAYADVGTPMLRSTDVRANMIRTNNILYLEPDFADNRTSKRLRAGDIVTVRTGNAGVSAVVPEEYDGGQCFTLVVSRPSIRTESRFLSYSLNSHPGQSQFRVEGMGTAQINISVPIVANTVTCLPPLGEQMRISAFLDQELTASANLIQRTHDAVRRLREFRTALISAAVTGQIDVRGEVA